MTNPRPACLITGVVSDHRLEPFSLLREREDVEVLAFRDAGGLAGVRAVGELEAARLAGSGRYRAVICGLGGRIALPGAYFGARRARVPFVLWASIWAHPRTAAHAVSYLPTRALYRRADAVVTYGPHVSAYVRARRAAGGIFEAPQAVSAELFGAPVGPARREAERARAGAGPDDFLALFVGRLEREKGVEVLLDAWRLGGLADHGALALAGDGPLRARASAAGPRVTVLGPVPRHELPQLYAAADVLVVPSIRTATFTEPWGLVVNEAMHQATPTIASDAVGAAAGGLVRDGRNGLVVPEGERQALADALRMLAGDRTLRDRLGAAARTDVAPFTPAAWVGGFERALAAVGASRSAQGDAAEPASVPGAGAGGIGGSASC